MHDRRIANALAARDYFVVGLWVHDDLYQLYDHSRYGVLPAHERGALGAKPHGSPVHLASSQLPPITCLHQSLPPVSATHDPKELSGWVQGAW